MKNPIKFRQSIQSNCDNDSIYFFNGNKIVAISQKDKRNIEIMKQKGFQMISSEKKNNLI